MFFFLFKPNLFFFFPQEHIGFNKTFIKPRVKCLVKTRDEEGEMESIFRTANSLVVRELTWDVGDPDLSEKYGLGT